MPPRTSKHSKPPLPIKTLVLDNGAYGIKAGFSLSSEPPPTEESVTSAAAPPACHEIPNCLAKGAHNRVYVGAQLADCSDYAELTFRRPVRRGCLVNWEAEKEIWEQSFFAAGRNTLLHCDPAETNLLLAEAPNGLSSLQANCDQMVFEEFEFAAYRRVAGPALNAYNDIAGAFGDAAPSQQQQSEEQQQEQRPVFPAECVLVVDSGYSHTTVTPLYKGRPIQQAVRRLDVGGKFVTNYLKEILSVRQLDVRLETHIINQVKEAMCFVSTDFKRDMEKAKEEFGKKKGDPAETANRIVMDYVMPDFTTRMAGELKAHDPKDRKQMAAFNHVKREDGTTEVVLALGNERFTPPELLFRPENVGMQQAGVAEMVLQSMAAVPTGLWAAMLGNVWVVGGNARFPGFKERL